MNQEQLRAERTQIEATIEEAARGADRLADQLSRQSFEHSERNRLRGIVASFRKAVLDGRYRLSQIDKELVTCDTPLTSEAYTKWHAKPDTTIEQPTSSGTGYNDALRHKDLTA